MFAGIDGFRGGELFSGRIGSEELAMGRFTSDVSGMSGTLVSCGIVGRLEMKGGFEIDVMRMVE